MINFIREYLESEEINSSPYKLEELLSVLNINEKITFEELQDTLEELKKSSNPQVNHYAIYLENLFLNYKINYIDPTTNFGNRNKLKEDIERNNFSEKFNLIRVKVRKISNINIAYGEKNTDFIIKEIGKKIRDEFGISSIYKMYGSEFAIVVDEDFASIKKRINSIEDSDINFGGFQIQVKLNASVVSLSEEYSNSEDLLSKSFTTLHASRDSSDIDFFDKEKHDNSYEKDMLLWTKKIDDILKYDIEKLEENKGILPYFQKIVYNLGSEYRKLWKFECLARMYDEKTGKICSPGSFLEPLTRSGKSYYLTQIIIIKALLEMKKYNFIGNSIVSFNLTGDDILEDYFIGFLIDQVNIFGIPREDIVLEIVEDTEYYQEVIEKLEYLKSLGFKIAIDDFGVNNSSFWNFVKNLKKFDFLKVDKKFIWNLSDENIKNTIRNFVDLSSSNGVSIIAEGVETQENQDLLVSLGVDYSQGFYFSKPSRLKDFL